MQNFLLVILTMIFVSFSMGQIVLDNFDSSAVKSIYELSTEGGDSYMDIYDDPADKVEGTASLYVHGVIGEHHPWGSYAQLIYTADSFADAQDWTVSDSLSLWIKVHEAPTRPENFLFRIHLKDQLNDGGDTEEYIYENTTIIDSVSDWFELKVPLIERETDGTTKPNDEGFVLFPSDWGGGTYNNNKLDRDKIVGWNISLITSGWTDPLNIPADSIKISYDNFVRFGVRSAPFMFFNGKVLASSIEASGWGQSTIEVEEGAGFTKGTNALKWVQGDEWNNGWTGITFDIDPAYNMSGVWASDSVKFRMKAEAGTGDMRLQFEDGSAKKGTVFSPVDDGEWHYYSFKLSDLTYQEGTSNFDSSSVSVVGIMAEESAIAGKVIYIDEFWTGNPVIDVAPPNAPTNVKGIANASEHYNVVAWTDVPGEDGAVYNVYASESIISDVTAPDVETVALNVEEGIQGANHYLRYPLNDKVVTYYYAVTCIDSAGNESTPGTDIEGETNTALGVPTISLNPPVDFVADGDISEWISADIDPLVLKPSTNKIGVGAFDNDDDFTANIYMAVDNDYLYVALDMYDDVYSVDGGGDWYLDDAAEMFIGLYNQTKRHSGFDRGAEPDYQLQFRYDGFYGGTPNLGKIYDVGSDNFDFVKYIGAYWCTELKLSLDTLAQDTDDAKFVPENGMRIPLDFSLHDADAAGVRDGMLAFSEANADLSYHGAQYWFYTWIGDTNKVTAIEDNNVNGMPDTYVLEQNYPNPFNPSTTIEYYLPKSAQVNLSIYNVLGQEVTTLVNTRQSAGEQRFVFDASQLSSGVYFYKLQADDFVQVKKMLLMK
jgi:hypothetical protein